MCIHIFLHINECTYTYFVMQSLYHVITCFEGVEKLEAKERRELPESDVLPSASLPDIYATEDAEHRPGHCGESQ